MHRFLTGFAAAAIFLMIEMLGRVLFEIPTIPELVQDRLVLSLPGPAFAFLLDKMLYLGKPVLFATLLAGQTFVLTLLAVPALRVRRPLPVAAVLWALTGLVVLPAADHGIFAERGDLAALLLVAFAGYGAALVLLPDAPAQVAAHEKPGSGAAAVDVMSGRRELLVGGAALVASVFLARRAVGSVPTLPGETSLGLGSQSDTSDGAPTAPSPPLPAMVTSAADFYLVSKNIADPELDGDSWRLELGGMLVRPATLSRSDLAAYPPTQLFRTLECISNELGGDLISNGRWTGVPLADVLRQAGVLTGAQVVHFTCADGYTENMPLQKALDPNTLLVYELDGAPLPNKHGFPLRLLGAGTYGMKNPKWITGIELAESAPEGFWEQQGWNPDAIVQTMSRIDMPSPNDSVRGPSIRIAGVAFAGDRGIQRVEVSTDGGASWSDASLLPSLEGFTWTFWKHTWRSAQPGGATLVARATDGRGQLQIADQTDTYPAGATGLHQVLVQVSA